MAGSVYATKQQEIGIHIYTPFRRKKIASEAILWLIQAHRLDRPLANVAPGNLKSHALFTKLGGTVIQHTYLLDGASPT
jgi:RimJ/RimL family protein N-acetyltransferase